MSKRPVLAKRMLIVEPTIQLPLLTYAFSMTAMGVALATSFASFWVHLPFATDSGWPTSVIFVISSIVIVTLMIILGMLMTNKVAGPLYRLHQHIKKVADGETVDPLVTRSDDFINKQLIEDYNRLLKRIK